MLQQVAEEKVDDFYLFSTDYISTMFNILIMSCVDRCVFTIPFGYSRAFTEVDTKVENNLSVELLRPERQSAFDADRTSTFV